MHRIIQVSLYVKRIADYQHCIIEVDGAIPIHVCTRKLIIAELVNVHGMAQHKQRVLRLNDAVVVNVAKKSRIRICFFKTCDKRRCRNVDVNAKAKTRFGRNQPSCCIVPAEESLSSVSRRNRKDLVLPSAVDIVTDPVYTDITAALCANVNIERKPGNYAVPANSVILVL